MIKLTKEKQKKLDSLSVDLEILFKLKRECIKKDKEYYKDPTYLNIEKELQKLHVEYMSIRSKLLVEKIKQFDYLKICTKSSLRTRSTTLFLKVCREKESSGLDNFTEDSNILRITHTECIKTCFYSETSSEIYITSSNRESASYVQLRINHPGYGYLNTLNSLGDLVQISEKEFNDIQIKVKKTLELFN